MRDRTSVVLAHKRVESHRAVQRPIAKARTQAASPGAVAQLSMDVLMVATTEMQQQPLLSSSHFQYEISVGWHAIGQSFTPYPGTTPENYPGWRTLGYLPGQDVN